MAYISKSWKHSAVVFSKLPSRRNRKDPWIPRALNSFITLWLWGSPGRPQNLCSQDRENTQQALKTDWNLVNVLRWLHLSPSSPPHKSSQQIQIQKPNKECEGTWGTSVWTILQVASPFIYKKGESKASIDNSMSLSSIPVTQALCTAAFCASQELAHISVSVLIPRVLYQDGSELTPTSHTWVPPLGLGTKQAFTRTRSHSRPLKTSIFRTSFCIGKFSGTINCEIKSIKSLLSIFQLSTVGKLFLVVCQPKP